MRAEDVEDIKVIPLFPLCPHILLRTSRLVLADTSLPPPSPPSPPSPTHSNFDIIVMSLTYDSEFSVAMLLYSAANLVPGFEMAPTDHERLETYLGMSGKNMALELHRE